MPQVARLIGGAGTGKTTELLSIMEKLIESGIRDPSKIGFVSFTRAARREAVERAALKFNIVPASLEREGWFRTLHSVCYRCLGVGGELLGPSAETAQWFEGLFDQQIESMGGREDGDSLEMAFAAGKSEYEFSLKIWESARNQLTSLDAIHATAHRFDEGIPPLVRCREIVEQYETAKRVDHRCDFTDLLGRFAGHKFRVGGVEEVTPEGDIPGLPAWLHDEAQDMSSLSASVFRRLISAPSCKYAYLVGDPFQSIFGFASSNSRHFMDWPVDKEKTMPKSYRCPPNILNYGEEILSTCSDYWDRDIEPADHKGTISAMWDCSTPSAAQWINQHVDPSESWLFLARTNGLANQLAEMLNTENIPWLPVKGGGTWAAPARHEGVMALHDIQQGKPIDGHRWKRILKMMPSKHEGQELFTRGTKARFDEKGEVAKYDWVNANELGELGATEAFRTIVQSGNWLELVHGAKKFMEAIHRYGEETALNSNVRIGTIHSVKGSEADNVVLLTTTNRIVENAQSERSGADEESRVRYVAVTRARKNLILFKQKNATSRMSLPVPNCELKRING